MPFEFLPQNDYLIINLTAECSGDEVPSLTETFQKKNSEKQIKYIIFQSAQCSHMSVGFMREISQIYKALKTTNGGLRLVGSTEKVLALIKAQGLDQILVNKMSLRGALVEFGLAKEKQIDVNFINPFLMATQKVFKIQCFLETTSQKPFLKKSSDPLLFGDISGIISISSESFNGTLAISLTEKIFCKIGSNMLGESITSINEGNIDLVGELANMILGQA
ncbi:MAG: chemotaxis protein CheX, partial [Bdellovibrionaceae bacterium]|nr:chemotaxis protein CheX [Pseudobdellovibrionaceae bacterium]